MNDAARGPHRSSLLGMIEDARAQTESVTAAGRPNREMIAGYQLKHELHRGGQGVVYLAHQRATSRDVAIKILRDGPFASSGDRARFEREVQVLAALKHPHIVAIHDSGIASDNYYFVMDYIPGLPLDEWADDRAPNGDGIINSASPRKGSRRQHANLIQVFLKICGALNVAHQSGIIHRDLKPSNIRISDDDEPFVLDFGLAKIAPHDASTLNNYVEETELTAAGQFLGTLPWASPEQVAERAYHADTRTDIYALGLMMYRAITGRMPYGQGVTVPDMIRIIATVEPTRPSDLVRGVEFDLETILLKCLHKDAARRYQTVNELELDLNRYLAYEPIGARRESGWYHLRMFARRNRMAVAAASIGALLLFVSSIVMAIMYGVAKKNERIANRRAAETAAMASFQQAQLSSVDPAQMGARIRADLLRRVSESAPTASDQNADDAKSALRRRQELEAALAGINFADVARASVQANIFEPSLHRIEAQFASQPQIRAALLQTMADTLHLQGLHIEAIDPQEKALTLFAQHLGSDHETTLNAKTLLATILRSNGRLADAHRHLEELLPTCRGKLGDEHPVTLSAIHEFGGACMDLQEFDDAEELIDEALTGRTRVLGKGHRSTLTTVNTLAQLYAERRQFQRAVALYDRWIVTMRNVLGPDDQEVLKAVSALGFVLRSLGRYQEALPYLTEAVDLRRQRLGDLHPKTLQSIASLSQVMTQLGRMQEALSLREEALGGKRAVLGDDHPITLVSMNGMADVLLKLGRFAEAEEIVEESINRHQRVLGENDLETGVALGLKSQILAATSRLDEAKPLAERSVTIAREALGETGVDTLAAIHRLGGIELGLGNHDAARALFEESLGGYQATLGPRSSRTLLVQLRLAQLLFRQQEFHLALNAYREVYAGWLKVGGPNQPNTISAQIGLGSTLRQLGKHDEAAKHYAEGLASYQRVFPEDHPYVLMTRTYVGELATLRGRLDEALHHLQAAERGTRQVLGNQHATTLRAITSLGRLYCEKGQLVDAEPLLTESQRGYESLPSSHSLRPRIAKALAAYYQLKHEAEPAAGHDTTAAEWANK